MLLKVFLLILIVFIEEEDNVGDKEEGKDAELKPTKKNKKADARVIPIDRFPGDDMPPIELPYATIEMVFNTRNVYANRQHHDPTKIYYNIYDPYIFFGNY